MRKGTVLLVLTALVFVIVPGCTTGTDGDGDVDGPHEADSIEEARAIADPLAEEWDEDAFCFSVEGHVVDENGILLGPENLTSDSDCWLFLYNAGQDSIFSVSVLYNGSYGTWEYDDEEESDYYELPDYSNARVKSVMNKADDEFGENLGGSDYLYFLTLTATETYNQAMVAALDSNFQLVGWIALDADTLEILGASWW
jgi:hypothetical protein